MNDINNFINDVHNMGAIEGMKELPDESIDMVMFSPPYFGLRSYSEENKKLWSRDNSCNHQMVSYTRKGITGGKKSKKVQIKGENNFQIVDDTEQKRCKKCESLICQLGREPTVDDYITHMLMIADEVKRVLKEDGSWYLNLGDTYIDKKKMMVPHRTAYSIQNNGFICRNDIIWRKTNPYPHPVKDRLNTTYELLFHFVKNKKYHYNLDNIREEHETKPKNKQKDNSYHPKGKNPGDVWTIPTTQFPDAHFAVYPTELCTKPIRASTSRNDIVLDPMCGAGTTLIEAQRLGRQWIGFDINQNYVNLSKKRIRRKCSQKIDEFILPLDK